MGVGRSVEESWARLSPRTTFFLWDVRHDHPDSVIDTGGLLIALGEAEGLIASAVLSEEKIDLRAVHHIHSALWESSVGGSVSPAALRAIHSAGGYADAFGDPHASTGHLLLGLLDELDGVAMIALGVLGVERRHLVARTRAHLHAARVTGTLDERALEEEFALSGAETVPAPPSQVRAAFAHRCEADPTLTMAVAPDGIVTIARTGPPDVALRFRLQEAVDTVVDWSVGLRVPVYSRHQRAAMLASQDEKLAIPAQEVVDMLHRLAPRDDRPRTAAEQAP